MRIRIVVRPTETTIDGIPLGRFEPGNVYDVGTTLGVLMLAEGWGEPVTSDAPALLVSLIEPAAPVHGAASRHDAERVRAFVSPEVAAAAADGQRKPR